jgi:hypothetical protein
VRRVVVCAHVPAEGGGADNGADGDGAVSGNVFDDSGTEVVDANAPRVSPAGDSDVSSSAGVGIGTTAATPWSVDGAASGTDGDGTDGDGDDDEGCGGGGGIGVGAQAADAGTCGGNAEPAVNDSPKSRSSRSALTTETNAGDPSSGSAVRVIAR